MMLEAEKPDDYVVATGVGHSVKEFAELAFSIADLNYEEYVVIEDVFNGIEMGKKMIEKLGYRKHQKDLKPQTNSWVF